MLASFFPDEVVTEEQLRTRQLLLRPGRVEPFPGILVLDPLDRLTPPEVFELAGLDTAAAPGDDALALLPPGASRSSLRDRGLALAFAERGTLVLWFSRAALLTLGAGSAGRHANPNYDF